MKLDSWCAITLNDVPILGASEMLEGELVPPDRVATYQPKDLFRAPYKDRIGRALVAHTFSFTRVKLLPTGLDARYFALAHAAELPIEPGDCLITGNAGGVWSLARAVLLSYAARTEHRLFIATYTITGGAYTILATPPPLPDNDNPALPPGEPETPSGDRLVDDDGALLTGGAGDAVTDDPEP